MFAAVGLASALFWLGDIAGTIANCEKAYAAFRRRGDAMFAAGAALSLVGYNKGLMAMHAVGQALVQQGRTARHAATRGLQHRERPSRRARRPAVQRGSASLDRARGKRRRRAHRHRTAHARRMLAHVRDHHPRHQLLYPERGTRAGRRLSHRGPRPRRLSAPAPGQLETAGEMLSN